MAGVKRSLAVDLGALHLSTPVVIASGCAGTGRELSGLVDLHKVGGLVSRTITVLPRKGASTPRVAETPSGIIWEVGFQNPGLDVFIADELPRLARTGVPVIVSIGGGTLEEFVRLSSALAGCPEVAAIEACLASSDDELARPLLGAHVDRVTEIVGAVSRMSSAPVFAKLPLWGGVLVELAGAAMRADATGVTLGFPPPALGVDIGGLKPSLGGVTGHLAGPALAPLALHAVFEVATAMPGIPIMASGGVRGGDDAVACVLAGATAVQVGTATLIDPTAAVEVATGVARYLKAKNLASPVDIRSRLRVPTAAPAGVREAPAP